MVHQVAKMLNQAATNTAPNNFDLNRTLWDNYARSWHPSKPWIKQMIKDADQEGNEESLILGDEWSDDASFRQVV